MVDVEVDGDFDPTERALEILLVDYPEARARREPQPLVHCARHGPLKKEETHPKKKKAGT